MSSYEDQVAAIISDQENDLIESVLVGQPLDLDLILNTPAFKTAAIHCCLNGPVGVGKTTSFPGIGGEFKIKSLYSGRLTNNMWRSFCEIIAETLIHKYPDLCNRSQQAKMNTQIWPLYELEED